MPQTPAPYFVDGAAPLPHSPYDQVKPADAQFSYFDQEYDDFALLRAEEADMDVSMGLGGLAPARNVQEGLLWDTLAPVEQFNHAHGCGE